MIIGKKIKRRSIRIKVGFYEVCLSYIIYCLLFFYYYTNTLSPAKFVVYLSLGERSSEIIGQKYLSQNIKS